MFNELMDRMALLQFNFEQRTIEEGREEDRRQGELDRRMEPGIPGLRPPRSGEATADRKPMSRDGASRKEHAESVQEEDAAGDSKKQADEAR